MTKYKIKKPLSTKQVLTAVSSTLRDCRGERSQATGHRARLLDWCHEGGGSLGEVRRGALPGFHLTPVLTFFLSILKANPAGICSNEAKLRASLGRLASGPTPVASCIRLMFKFTACDFSIQNHLFIYPINTPCCVSAHKEVNKK